jgi:hypothetical protein
VGKDSLLSMKLWFRSVSISSTRSGHEYEIVSGEANGSGNVVTISNKLKQGDGERAVMAQVALGGDARQRFTVRL